jgi:protein SCO1/2
MCSKNGKVISVLIFLLVLVGQGCKKEAQHAGNAATNVVGISDQSIFVLDSKWNTEEGKSIVLADLKGEVLVVVMIYTSCQVACPRLVADMKALHDKVKKTTPEKVRYVLVSIDPEIDTPTRLKEFAIKNEMDGEEWTFLQGTSETVREFANVLSIKYKEISPTDFSHSNIISVFNPSGELLHQMEGVGVNNTETSDKILAAANEL